MSKEELRISEATTLLNKHSGLLGVSGISNDMRELLAAEESGDANAALAIRMFTYRLKKYIGAYAAAMAGCDHLVFTGGIGENSPKIRAQATEGLEFLGVTIDPSRNEDTETKGEREISPDGAPVKVWVIPADEELVIARDTVRCIEGVISARG